MLTPVHFSGEPSYIAPTWNELHALAFKVCKIMRKKGLKFDRLITLAKGGWPLSLAFVDLLAIPQVASVGVRFYAGINKHLKEPQIYQDLPVAVQGERVLLYDDVVDTGESMMFVKDYLLKHGVAEVTTASLFYKPRSKVNPDFFGHETNHWIVFPYDFREFFDMKVPGWLKAGMSKKEIFSRFSQLGCKKAWVKELLAVSGESG